MHDVVSKKPPHAPFGNYAMFVRVRRRELGVQWQGVRHLHYVDNIDGHVASLALLRQSEGVGEAHGLVVRCCALYGHKDVPDFVFFLTGKNIMRQLFLICLASSRRSSLERKFCLFTYIYGFGTHLLRSRRPSVLVTRRRASRHGIAESPT